MLELLKTEGLLNRLSEVTIGDACICFFDARSDGVPDHRQDPEPVQLTPAQQRAKEIVDAFPRAKIPESVARLARGEGVDFDE